MSTKIARPQRTRPRKCLGERYPMRLGPRLEMLEDRRLLSISIGTDDQDALLSGMNEYERWLDSLRTSDVFSVPIAVVRSEATNTVPTIGEMFDLAADFHARYVEPAEDYFAMAGETADSEGLAMAVGTTDHSDPSRIAFSLDWHFDYTASYVYDLETFSAVDIEFIETEPQAIPVTGSIDVGGIMGLDRKPTPSLRTFSSWTMASISPSRATRKRSIVMPSWAHSRPRSTTERSTSRFHRAVNSPALASVMPFYDGHAIHRSRGTHRHQWRFGAVHDELARLGRDSGGAQPMDHARRADEHRHRVHDL